MAELTPMMQQYMKTKEEYKDCILFIDWEFCEMFFDDAIQHKRTGDHPDRENCGLEERAPMCEYLITLWTVT